MELWISDYHTEKVKVSVKVQKQLFGLQTEFQRIDVFDSDEFGRFLSSDGSIVFSEKDEFVYDEMIVHVPMAVTPHRADRCRGAGPCICRGLQGIFSGQCMRSVG